MASFLDFLGQLASTGLPIAGGLAKGAVQGTEMRSQLDMRRAQMEDMRRRGALAEAENQRAEGLFPFKRQAAEQEVGGLSREVLEAAIADRPGLATAFQAPRSGAPTFGGMNEAQQRQALGLFATNEDLLLNKSLRGARGQPRVGRGPAYAEISKQVNTLSDEIKALELQRTRQTVGLMRPMLPEAKARLEQERASTLEKLRRKEQELEAARRQQTAMTSSILSGAGVDVPDSAPNVDYNPFLSK